METTNIKGYNHIGKNVQNINTKIRRIHSVQVLNTCPCH